MQELSIAESILEAVRKEQIPVLPFLFKGKGDNKISGY